MLMKSSLLFGTERQAQILALIGEHGSVNVANLVARFSISPATARRDLDEMAANGQLRRTHGGAVARSERQTDSAFAARQALHIEEKSRIGRICAGLIGSDETIFLDAGTTVLTVARHIQPPGPALIVTNSAPLPLGLPAALRAQIYVIGGEFRAANLSHVGADAVAALATFRFSTAVIGCGGIDPERGIVTTPSVAEAAVQRAAIMRANRVIVVADTSKFGAEAAVVITALDAVTTIVTGGLPADTVKRLGPWNLQLVQT